MNTSILLTGAGGPAAISFFKALDIEKVTTHMADMDPHAAGLYLVPQERRALVPRGDAPEFVAAILDLCVRFRIDVLIPTVDAELVPIARAQARFAANGVKVMLPSLRALETCLDKWLLYRALAEVVPMPRTWLASEAGALTDADFPLILKPRRGSGSRGVTLLRQRSDLPALDDPKRWLLQEYLPGAEYSVDVLAASAGQVLAAVPRVRLKVDSGIAVTSRTVKDSRLEGMARTIVSHLGLSFIANVQLRRRANGEPVLLEINPRAPGTMPLTVAAGVNMPWFALRACRGEDISAMVMDFEEIAVVRFWREHFMSVQELDQLKREAPYLPADAAE